MKKCPCHSGDLYKQCCQPFHTGKEFPQTPLKLMRSRYSAYALGLFEYIMHTTHPTSPHYRSDPIPWKDELLSFSKNTQFHGLDILSDQNGFPEASVTFRAHLSSQGQDQSFTERSLFIYQEGRWLYVQGEMIG